MQSTVAPTNLKSGPVILTTSGPVQPEESQLLASPASPLNHDDAAIRAATKWTIRILQDLSSEITEVIETINVNIDHQRAELCVCLPELGRVLSGLMEDHSQQVKLVRHLASKLGDHGLVDEMVQEQARLEDEADEAFRLVVIFAIEEDLIETQDYDDTVQAGSVTTVLGAVSDTDSGRHKHSTSDSFLHCSISGSTRHCSNSDKISHCSISGWVR